MRSIRSKGTRKKKGGLNEMESSERKEKKKLGKTKRFSLFQLLRGKERMKISQ